MFAESVPAGHIMAGFLRRPLLLEVYFGNSASLHLERGLSIVLNCGPESAEFRDTLIRLSNTITLH